ncbi:ABC-2 type transport system permease protein [Nocardia fluminea]|uniref:ABC-2 type transport system permease protein n=1 Tax=Nocardia fluminea TaxID=134984 RepID=A0A2N3VG39_9NOCA|nr:ABC-2 type transport system permease protein [Nocardia fluminea]
MLTGFPGATAPIGHDGDVQTTHELASDRAPTVAFLQWWVLARRLIRPAWRTGEIFTALLAPAVFTLGFYVPLNLVMTVYGHGLSSYAQFLMPMIVMQAVAFCAISAAFRAATDARDGLDVRFATLPMPRWVPFAARIAMAAHRAVIAIGAALVCGAVIGFRFYGSWWHTVGFLAFSLLIATALCCGADLLGSMSASPEATTQILVLPQLIFGMVSTGFAPASQFPGWIQGFARNQPVSQFVDGLRALAGDSTGNAGAVDLATLGPGLAWAFGLLVVGGGLSWRHAARRSA